MYRAELLTWRYEQNWDMVHASKMRRCNVSEMTKKRRKHGIKKKISLTKLVILDLKVMVVKGHQR